MSETLKVKIINRSGLDLPAYKTPQSAGLDLCSASEDPIDLAPGERCLVPTGLYLELPAGYEAQVRPRSGLALKHGLGVLNSPGTIDSDYRGELRVIMINHGQEKFTIERGDRIAQMVIARHAQAQFIEVEALSETGRGSGGFGSTGRQ